MPLPIIDPRTIVTRPQAQAQPEQSALDKALGILNTPGGAALVSAAGAGIGAYGANKAASEGRAQNARQFQAEMAERQLNSDRNFQQGGAIAAANASPLGSEQMFAARNAMLLPILQGARNFSVTPGDPRIAKAMGAGPQGGLRTPEGGFDPEMLQRMFGDKATMESIANRQQMVGQINPRAMPLNLGTLYGEAGTAASQGVVDANTMEMNRQLEQQAQQRALIQRAIDEDIRGEKQKKEGGGNIFGKILKGIGKGASFIPGVGQIVAPIATGIGGLVNGDGLKSSLINAGMSAVPGLAAAGKLGSVAKGVVGNPWAKAIMGGR